LDVVLCRHRHGLCARSTEGVAQLSVLRADVSAYGLSDDVLRFIQESEVTKNNSMPTQEFLDSIAKNVRDRRINQQLTQERLAELCGCKKTIINLVERAVVMNHSISTVEMIADGLGCDVVDLLRRHERTQTKSVGEAYLHESSTTKEKLSD
jgi:DNA-binding XRE family transcriptional regulator